jgi:hypothetical protein
VPPPVAVGVVRVAEAAPVIATASTTTAAMHQSASLRCLARRSLT